MTTTKELCERLDALEKKARIAEDYVAIANLQAAYGYYVDKGLWDKAADLFASDGTLEIAGRGVYVGQDRVRQYLHQLPEYGDGTIFNHMQLQPVIHIDSEAGTAKGRWRTLMMVGFLNKEGRWGEATYENAYVREGEKWRIASLHGIINFYCEYDEGWHRGGVPLLRSTAGIAPDLPQSFEYEAHPKAVIAPFHYDEV
ncbi:hypothetical protein GCM10009127_08230 [Alteraurantiacibacter aestuarii]|nr:nuclear transport factor 2 family protein [Alteraurantiacibacter aestuarii]